MGHQPLGLKNREATGNKEDARTLNHFLDTMEMKINKYKTDLLYTEKSISAQRIIDFVLGKATSKATILEELRSTMIDVRLDWERLCLSYSQAL